MGKEKIVEVGDRFQECDKRFTRIVEVVAIEKNRARIKTIFQRADSRQLCTGRVTTARLDRFFRYSNGYRYLGGRCHDCQLKAGAVVPKGGHIGITVSIGTCGGCLKEGATLVPGCDYHWPKEGKKAIFD